jgi:hypothetical protein
MEESLGKALDLVKNQLELFETFPLHGHPAKIIRNDQGQINPQDVDLRYLATHQTVELADITSEEGASITVQTEDGKQETANAVIPLFGAEDADLVPFINSRLYKLLLTWSLVRDPDTLLDESFNCMLNAVFKYALVSTKPEQGLVDKAVVNLTLIRSSQAEGGLFSNVPSDLNSLTKELDLDKKTRAAPIPKVLLNAYSHFKTGKINQEQLKSLVSYAQAAALKTLINGEVSKLKRLFDLEIKKTETEDSHEVQIAKKIKSQFAKVRSLGDLARKLAAEITDVTLNADVNIHYLPGRLDKLVENDDRFSLLKRFREAVGLPEFSQAESEALVFAAFEAKGEDIDLNVLSDTTTSKAAVKTALKEDLKKEKDVKAPGSKKGKKGKVASKPLTSAKSKEIQRNPIFKALYPVLEKEFQEFFKQVHKEVVPLPPAELEAYCKTHSLNFKGIKFNEATHLPIRTCAAQGCYYFMRNMPRLDSHLQVWGVKLPQGFHLVVKENQAKSTKEIYEIFAKSHFSTVDGQTVPFDPKRFDKSEEEVLGYIDKLRVAYGKIA